MPEKTPKPDDADYAAVNPSGEVRGKKITLDEVLPHMKAFKLRQPYIYLVGGLAIHGETVNDIDILIKDTEALPPEFIHVLQWRILRALPVELRDRVQFHFDGFHGPITDNIPLYDLTVERVNAENEVFRMDATGADGFANDVAEFQTWLQKRADVICIQDDDDIEKMNKLFPVTGGKRMVARRLIGMFPEHKTYVEAFAGGATMFYGKRPSDKEVLNDMNPDYAFLHRFARDVTDEQIQKLQKRKLKIDAEYFHQLATTKPTTPLDRFHALMYRTKYSYGGKYQNNTHVSVVEANRDGSLIGKYTSLPKFRARLKGVTILNSDYKAVLHKYDASDTFFYIDPPYEGSEDKGLDIGELDTAELVKELKKLKGKFLLSYNGKDIKKKFKGFHVYLIHKSPSGNWSHETTEYVIANYDIKAAEKANRKKGDGWLAKSFDIEKQADPYMRLPSEDETHRYVVQDHWRGKSLHNDFRIETEPGGVLIGWTLNTQIPGIIKEPILTLAKAKALMPLAYSKIDWNTGEFAQRRKAGATALVDVQIVCERKKQEPHAWLDVEGVVKAGGIGATKQYPGVFHIVDKGTCEYGTQKPWFHEYWPKSSRAKGGFRYRVMFRQLRVADIQDAEKFASPALIKEYLRHDPDIAREDWDEAYWAFMHATKQLVLPAAEAKFREEATWLLIKPIDQTPYALSDRAVKEEWIPPHGFSALPKAIRDKVPAEYRYWQMANETERRQMRDALVVALDAGEVSLPGIDRNN